MHHDANGHFSDNKSTPVSPTGIPQEEDPWDFVITVDHVMWLSKNCGIVQENPLKSLEECSSSLFVLLFQRLLNVAIPNLELEPNTLQKKLWNTTQVLEQLQEYLSLDLSHISAEEIVSGNKQHISMLIRVFLHLAVHLLHSQQHDAPAAPTDAQAGEGDDTRVIFDTKLERGSGGGEKKSISEPSSHDSANYTNRLVSSWKEEIIAPLRRKVGVAVNPKEVSNLNQRILNVDQALRLTTKGGGRRVRPSVHDTREKVVVLSPRELFGVNPRRLTDSAARDAKIETLRALRFIDELHQAVRSSIKQRDSALESELREDLRARIKMDRQDFRDQKKWAKDEDDRLRAAYASIIASARPASDQRLYRDETRRIADQHIKKQREAKRSASNTAQEYHRNTQERLQHLVGHATMWQSGLFR